MKIRNRLTLLVSIVFGSILLAFVVGVYQFYSNKCKEDYFDRLRFRAELKIDLIDGETVDPDILHAIYESSPPNMEPQLTAYDLRSGTMVYRDKQWTLPPRVYKDIVTSVTHSRTPVERWEGNNQLCGFVHRGDRTTYAVITSGHDILGERQLSQLRMALAVAYILAMIATAFTARFFTKKALQPVALMTDKVKDITLSNHLGLRLDEGNRQDEVAQLAIMFNQLLAQLEKSFDSQKQFVYNISHELRTPLSAIIAELELSTDNPHITTDDYHRIVSKVLDDAHRIVKLSNNLLDLAKANYSPAEIGMRELRLDELLLNLCGSVQNNNTGYAVQLIFDVDDIDDDRSISIMGNEYLLGVAFGNLMDNGCKFSPSHSCEVHIGYDAHDAIVRVIDHGIGIVEDDREAIFQPFYRGCNKGFADGNGIGLSLTKRIIELHKGKIILDSRAGLTEFTVRMKNCF